MFLLLYKDTIEEQKHLIKIKKEKMLIIYSLIIFDTKIVVDKEKDSIYAIYMCQSLIYPF